VEDLIGLVNGVYETSQTNLDTFRSFVNSSTQTLPQCFAGYALSSQSAFTKAIEAVSSSTLENLSQLGEIFGLFDAFDLVNALKRLRHRNVYTLLSLLDLIASAELLYSFALLPTYDDAVEYATRGERVYQAIKASGIMAALESRGKHVLNIPESYRYRFTSGAYVTTRTKIRYTVHPDCLLTACLPLKTLGLLPTISNLWNLVPMSFVLDWFFGLGTNLERIEDSALMLALDVQCVVNTTNLFNPLPNDILAEFGLYRDGLSTQECGYTLFYREVSGVVPIMYPTNLPFYAAGGLPNWETPSSLLWTLVRGK
jgi:hypothetical protein